MEIESRYRKVIRRIEAARERSFLKVPQVFLLAVSKTQSTEKIEQVYGLGQRDFGENYVQELVQKADDLKEKLPGIRWHMIGHLQTNKVKEVVKWADVIHSVDSLKLAEEISKRAQKKISVFIQVNVDQEASKSGVLVSEVPEMAKKIAAMPNIQLEGLMCIPAPGGNVRESFKKIRELEQSCRPLTQGQLSMGMSQDLEIAIEEGATWVRVGSDIFGARE